MIIRRILTTRIGRTTVSMDLVEPSSSGGQGLYDRLVPMAWRRAARLIERFGVDEALAELDRRAERCVDRRDVPSAVRWRNLMAAIHAISSDQCDKRRMN